MMLNGYILLHRKLMQWGWYRNDVIKSVFIHLLLSASFQESQWEGITIKRGQLVTSYKNLALDIGHTVQEVRTAINKLKSTREITCTATNKFTLITIVNWEDYQIPLEFLTNKLTSTLTNEQQTTNKQLTFNQQTTNNNVIRKNKDNNVNKDNKDNNILSSETRPCEPSKEEKAKEDKKIYKDIIDYLNSKTGSSYRHSSKETQKHIRARLKEGFVLEDFKTVIDKKCEEWKNTDMEKFLRPSTLFGTKFEQYLNAKDPKKAKAERQIKFIGGLQL